MAEEEWETAILDLNLTSTRENQPSDDISDGFATENVRAIPVRSNTTTPPQDDLPVDQALASALEQPRERHNVLKFEDKMVRFMKMPREQRLEFPPLSGFHRLLVHRLAIRFGLEHQALEISLGSIGMMQQGGAYDTINRDICPMVLTKTRHCEIPRTLLIDLFNPSSESASQSSISPSQSSVSSKKIMLMKRDPKGKKHAPTQGSTVGKARQLSVAEKEKAYAAARARIFGTGNDDGSSNVSDESNATDTTVGSLVPSADKSTGLLSHLDADMKKQIGQIRMSAGPDGTNGFCMNRSKALNKMANENDAVSSNFPEADTTQKEKLAAQKCNTQLLQKNEKEKKIKNTSEKERKKSSNEKKVQVVNAGEWLKDGKVKARRRAENTSDPDFQRNYEVYRPNFAPYRESSPPPSQLSHMVHVQNSVPMTQWAPDSHQYMQLTQGRYETSQMQQQMYYQDNSGIAYSTPHQYGNVSRQQQGQSDDTDYYATQLAHSQAMQMAQHQQQINYYSTAQNQQQYIGNSDYSMQPHPTYGVQQPTHYSQGSRMPNSSYNDNFPALS